MNTDLSHEINDSVRSYGSERRSANRSRSLFSRPHRPQAWAGGRRGAIGADSFGCIDVIEWRGWGYPAPAQEVRKEKSMFLCLRAD